MALGAAVKVACPLFCSLDFTAVSSAPSGKALEAALQMIVTRTQDRLLEYGPFAFTWRRHVERTPHPRGQEAFDIHIQFPWQRNPLIMIKIEITFDEPMILDRQERLLVHGYEEGLEAVLRCYSLEEILAEKLRAVLQAQPVSYTHLTLPTIYSV